MVKATLFSAKEYDRQSFRDSSGESGISWDFTPLPIEKDTVAAAAGSFAVCAFVNDRLDEPCLRALSEVGVRVIALRCAGFNNINLPAARRLGLKVVRVPAYTPHAVGEHVLALLLTLSRKTHKAYLRVREQNFSLAGLEGFTIHGKKVGIVGTGAIGKVTARIIKGFGAELYGFDLYRDEAWAAETGLRYLSLEELLSTCDIISLHVPLIDGTTHLIDAAALARLKPGAYLVNTGRGKLIDTKALIAALKKGKLGGVALDVYEEEEGIFFEDHSMAALQDDQLARLMTFPNVLITAHQGFLTVEALADIAETTCANVLRLSRGETPLDGTELA